MSEETEGPEVSAARALFVRAVNADNSGFYDEACRLYADGLVKLTSYVNNPGQSVT